MLVTFRSTATESITLFGEHASALLKLMGTTGRVPGALGAEDVPAALSSLEKAVERLKTEARAEAQAQTDDRVSRAPASSKVASAEVGDDSHREHSDADQAPPISIEMRAVPLIALLKRAAAAGAEVMWQAS
ncbi:hypothetical protein ACG33_02400 [Steroidobacter denitrificans]|uniref:DUF1840 domain-containing protein n=1 Tax=Steroidobacter denitrificans TaxID=465721 RepID=A0A127F8U0_STEDE|nr:DUF1840 domain-containing protein [Steroidobacter denitrificans]AMN45980.1 hypothetical protein ACG33_02400 [Steroidobacter denitrificans]